MKTKTRYALLALALMFATSIAAHAKGRGWDYDHDKHGWDPVAPEVDPSLAIGGITLLAGALTALRARKNK
jgi:hypothetical protein